MLVCVRGVSVACICVGVCACVCVCVCVCVCTLLCVCVRERECTQTRNKAVSEQHTHLPIIDQAKPKDENRGAERTKRGVCLFI